MYHLRMSEICKARIYLRKDYFVFIFSYYLNILEYLFKPSKMKKTQKT